MAASSQRAPRLDIRLNDHPLTGAFAAEIFSNNHLAADRFSVRAAIVAASVQSFANQSDVILDLRVTLGIAPATSLVRGAVDRIEIDAIAGTIRIDGRDLSAGLIEARSRETFANQTSSEIALVLAGRHGLTPDVQRTATPVGRYWELEHDSITLDQFSRARSEWDLLVTLAGHEGFDVWVSGATLHFRPVATVPSRPAATLRPVPTSNGPANVTAIRLERALTLARDIEVTVKSWNSRQQVAFTQTARASGLGGGGGIGRSSKKLDYIFVVPNLSADDALKLAQRKLVEISSHERIVIADMPGELILAPRMVIGIEGTGSAFDQNYVIDEIERRFDLHGGFTQRVRARLCNAS